jgi:CRP/FNR family transcriptional regulator, polysaccharide utilization system transcription regulator
MQYPYRYIAMFTEGSESVFRNLSPKEKELLTAHHSVARVPRGGTIFSKGEKSKELIVLAEGKAKIFRCGIAGREHIIKLVRPGDMLESEILFTDSIWPSTSIAIEDSVIVKIETQLMFRLMKDNPDLSMRISKFLAEEIAVSYNKMVSLTQKHVMGRLAESILEIGEVYGFEDDGITLSARLSRDDIAHLSNMTTSNAIRTLSLFATEGILRMKRRQITILDPEGLKRISEQA